MDPVAEGPLDSRVLVQSHAAPGVGDGMEALPVARRQGQDRLGRLPGWLIDCGQERRILAQVLQVSIDLHGQVFVVPDQEVQFGFPCRRHFDFDFERQRLAALENALKVLVVAEYRIESPLLVPDDADEQQADQSKAKAKLLADPQFAGKSDHISLLSGETGIDRGRSRPVRSPRRACGQRRRAD